MHAYRTDLLVLAIIATAKAFGAESSGTESEGKAILENHCARCHSIRASGRAHFTRLLHFEKFICDTLSNNCQKVWRKGWVQGIVRCPKSNSLPTRWLAILNYLGRITGIAPAERAVIRPDDADRADPP